jgi:hypothetical protein
MDTGTYFLQVTTDFSIRCSQCGRKGVVTYNPQFPLVPSQWVGKGLSFCESCSDSRFESLSYISPYPFKPASIFLVFWRWLCHE